MLSLSPPLSIYVIPFMKKYILPISLHYYHARLLISRAEDAEQAFEA